MRTMFDSVKELLEAVDNGTLVKGTEITFSNGNRCTFTGGSASKFVMASSITASEIIKQLMEDRGFKAVFKECFGETVYRG